MTIEEAIFDNHRAQEDRLAACGFRQEGDCLVWERELPEAGLLLRVEYDGAFRGRVLDPATDEEYTLFRRADASGFSAAVREQFTGCLLDIRGKCCRNLHYRSPQGRRIHEYITSRYGDGAEYLWPKLPTFAAYRRKDSGKWYAVTARLPLCKVNPAAAPGVEAEVINLKVEKEALAGRLSREGVFEAYHMNKKSWISIPMDGTVPDGELCALIDESHALV